MKDTRADLTQGSVLLAVLSMAAPTAVGLLAQSVYDIVDLFWIGRLADGASAIAGVTVFLQVLWMLEILNEVIGMSSVSLISQSYGAGDLGRTRTVIEQTLVFKALVALAAGCIGFAVLRPLVGFFTSDARAASSALAYGRIRLLTLPLMFSSYTVNTALRNVGDARRPMLIMGASAVLNVVLDPLFMFHRLPGVGLPGLGLGVFGAALATVVSTGVAFLLGLGFLVSPRSRVPIRPRGLLRLHAAIDRQLISIGLPAGAEMLTRHLAQAVVLKVASVHGTAAVAALGIVFRLFGFAFTPLLGLHMGGATVVGQNLGAEKLPRAHATARAAVLVGLIAAAILSLAAWFTAGALVGVFTSDAQTLRAAVPLVRVFCLVLLVVAVTFGLGTVFSGAGYTLPFLVSSLLAKFGFQVPFLLLLHLVLGLPLVALWLSFLGSELIELGVVLVFYRVGRWKSVRV